MKRIAFALIFLGTLGLSIDAQTSRGTRPRVAPTPTPQIVDPQEQQTTRPQNDGPPVLQGGRRTIPQTQNTPSGTSGDENEIVKIETNLVTMPVSVLDRDGRFVSGLTQRDFQIFENGKLQQVEYFQSVEQPFTVALMIDVSPSTAFRIDEIHDAAITFIEQLRPNDKVMVIAFDDSVRVLSPPTNNREQLRWAIRQAQFGDGTGLYEAVDRALAYELARVEGRKAIVLFTDGVDTTSRRATYQSTIADTEETNVLIYPIRYNTESQYGGMSRGGGWGRPNRRSGGGSWGGIAGIILGGRFPQVQSPAGSSPQEYETGNRYLEDLAKNSGGRKFEADSTANLDAAFAGIAEELRRQYSLGYYPENVGQIGERKQIRIRVSRPNLVVRAKTSYIVGQSEDRFAGR
jgi:Ca-activated chloride channel family protein